jgi:hypothetical protein
MGIFVKNHAGTIPSPARALRSMRLPPNIGKGITAQIRGNLEKQETSAMRTTLLPLRLTLGIALSVGVCRV